ncbi:MAG: phasin family protein [Rhodospirillales bacterium]
MATEKTVTSAASAAKAETAKPSAAPVAPEKTAPVKTAVETVDTPVEKKPEVSQVKPSPAAPVEAKPADAPVAAKPAAVKAKSPAAVKRKPAAAKKPKVAARAKAPKPRKAAKPVEARPESPAVKPAARARQVPETVSPFGTAEAINAEMTNATVRLNETISALVSGGMNRSVRHFEAVRNVKDLNELYSMNTKFLEAGFESWMAASLKALGTGNELVGRVSAPVEEQVRSLTRTLQDRFPG